MDVLWASWVLRGRGNLSHTGLLNINSGSLSAAVLCSLLEDLQSVIKVEDLFFWRMSVTVSQ